MARALRSSLKGGAPVDGLPTVGLDAGRPLTPRASEWPSLATTSSMLIHPRSTTWSSAASRNSRAGPDESSVGDMTPSQLLSPRVMLRGRGGWSVVGAPWAYHEMAVVDFGID
jgi:hypothetical protein